MRFTVSFRASLPRNLRSHLATLNGNQSKFGITEMFVEFYDKQNICKLNEVDEQFVYFILFGIDMIFVCLATNFKCGFANESMPKWDEECRLDKIVEVSEHNEM